VLRAVIAYGGAAFGGNPLNDVTLFQNTPTSSPS
jgi:hypothetical protein